MAKEKIRAIRYIIVTMGLIASLVCIEGDPIKALLFALAAALLVPKGARR